jgi:hypothetical protein
MPLSPATLQPVIYGSMSVVGLLGAKTGQLAQGIANGVMGWIAIAKVNVSGAGTAGAGAVSMPMIIPVPGLVGTMLTAFSTQAMAGIGSPQMATGIGTGVAMGITSQSLLLATVVGVGSGAGVAKVVGTAVPPMVAGFAGVGLLGVHAVRLATAIGTGMDLFFSHLSSIQFLSLDHRARILEWVLVWVRSHEDVDGRFSQRLRTRTAPSWRI